MNKDNMKKILLAVENKTLSVDDALLQLKMKPFIDIGYAKIDQHRELRQGFPEVIYGERKSIEHIKGILETILSDNPNQKILITRISEDIAESLNNISNFTYYPVAQIGIIGKIKLNDSGFALVITGGTSDIPIAEEAALTLEAFGFKAKRLYDVGVSGLHRLLNHLPLIMNAKVIITVAGMEGALSSVVGGLVDVPVIGVPTSIGYGANFKGLSALLTMLNSCASGVGVVNIDNGFGAGYLSALIMKGAK